MQVNHPEIVAEVTKAFYAYEAALMSDDIPAMDALFYHSDQTVRYGVGEVLYGIEEIREFRKGRGGSPQRKLGRVAITTYGDRFATVNAEFFREGSTKRGRQSQSWVKFPDGWKVVSAHVSLEGANLMMTMDQINAMTDEDFVTTFGFLFENSPWVVEDAIEFRPFVDLSAMYAALMVAMYDTYGEGHTHVDLLKAHPKLADKAAIAAGLTKESASEQASVGLDALTPWEYKLFNDLNRAYEDKFGFPFIICVRLAGDVSNIIMEMQRRLKNGRSSEIGNALDEVGKIVRLRLMDFTGGTI